MGHGYAALYARPAPESLELISGRKYFCSDRIFPDRVGIRIFCQGCSFTHPLSSQAALDSWAAHHHCSADRLQSLWAEFRPIIDFATPAILAILLFVLGAVLLLTALPKDAHQPARFLALGMLFGASVWAFRLLFLAGFVNGRDDSVETLVLNLISIAHLLATVGCTFALFSIEVRKMESALSKVAFSDALTNLPNRRAALERFQQERARATRHGQSFAMLVIDIDHFKKINDDYGHLAGDAMLKQIASVLESSKRAEDVLGRIGGEEFVLLLVDPQVGEASAAAERLRQNVEVMRLSFNGKTHTATVSIGIALYPIDGEDWDSVFAVADQRLYQSKQAGRNRVTGLSITL